jgi:hypothetical protein
MVASFTGINRAFVRRFRFCRKLIKIIIFNDLPLFNFSLIDKAVEEISEDLFSSLALLLSSGVAISVASAEIWSILRFRV